MADGDRKYFARRAGVEFDLSINSPSSSARAVHAEMAGLYAGRMNAILEVVLGDKAKAIVERASRGVSAQG